MLKIRTPFLIINGTGAKAVAQAERQKWRHLHALSK
jgi:hypothetical protein